MPQKMDKGGTNDLDVVSQIRHPGIKKGGATAGMECGIYCTRQVAHIRDIDRRIYTG